jgi:hypothetical protein
VPTKELTVTEQTWTPVDFADIAEGDTLLFTTRDNGFGGSGDFIERTGTVTKVTAKTVTVKVVGSNPFAENVFSGGKSRELGRTAVLRLADWYGRSVRRLVTDEPRRREFTEENIQYVHERGQVTAVFIADPKLARDPKAALDAWMNSGLVDDAGVQPVAEATLFRQTEGASFSGWVVRRGLEYADQVPNKAEAMEQLRLAVAQHFNR